MSDRVIRWGLLGAGNIVNRWMNGVRQTEGMEIAAVASRTPERAALMADKFSIPAALSYDEMIARDDIDVVYIPVPHVAHKELAIRAMRSGKAVLVEKPAAVNADEFQEMIDCAKENNVFLMEAIWTKFFPLIECIRAYVGEQGIGQIRTIATSFSSRNEAPPLRVTEPELAGGGLLDLGVYDLHFNRMILQKSPVSLTGTASVGTDELHLKVDEQAAMIAQYDQGELGIMSCGIRTKMIDTAYIYGTKGYIEIPVFWKPTSMTVTIGSQVTNEECQVPQRTPGIPDEGFQYEIIHVNECLRRGLIESPVMTWADSLDVLRQCDALRRQWGVFYPGDTFVTPNPYVCQS